MRSFASDNTFDPHAKKGSVAVLASLWRYLCPYNVALFCAFLALIITSASVLGLGHGIRLLVDSGFSAHNPERLDAALLILVSITVVLALATFARFFFITYVGEKVVADLRRDLYHHLLTLSPGFFEVTKTGDLLSRMTTDTTLLQSVVGSSISIALRNFLLLLGGIALLLIASPSLVAWILIMVPVVVFPIIVIGRKVRMLSRLSQDRVADIAAHTEETLHGIQVIQAFSRERFERDAFHHFVADAFATAMQRVRWRGFLTAVVIILVLGAVGFVLWVGGHDVLSGHMSPGELSSFLFYSIVVASATGALSEVYGELQRAAGALERLLQLLATTSVVPAPTKAQTLPDDLTGTLTLTDLHFSYPSAPETKALQGVSFTVPAGKTVALVGPSGTGKSTLLRLLLRFYDPQNGAITVDDYDIRSFALDDLRSLFGFVPQDTVIFSGTVYDNILFGRPDADKDAVYKAADAAAALEFIEQLPNGFDTFVGEKGVRLSGGQKQRIAIARAFLRDPKILLLDEATSSLDTENERFVQQALHSLMEHRTTVVVAHRLSTILHADHIVVLQDGKVDTIGTHKELLKKSDLYQSLASF